MTNSVTDDSGDEQTYVEPVKQIPASVDHIKSIASNTTEVTFRLSEPLNFVAGQYVTVILPQLSDLPVREQFRDFSIASAPESDQEISIAFRNSDSAFKTAICNKSAHVDALIEGPKGSITLPHNVHQKVAFIAGGIGITPFISMLRHIKLTKSTVKPTLFYCCTSLASAPYLSEIKELGKYVDLILIIGELGPEEVTSYTNANGKHVNWYLAGPSEMVIKGREILTSLHIDEKHIQSEEFTGYR
jgi:ferredoxin-NADP reductase